MVRLEADGVGWGARAAWTGSVGGRTVSDVGARAGGDDGVGAGAAGTVAYFRGELVSTFDNTFDEAFEATQKAVDELELIRISEKKDALSAVFTVQTAKDKKVSIILDKLDHEVTSVTIRVGIMGDESLSLTILGKIRENL